MTSTATTPPSGTPSAVTTNSLIPGGSVTATTVKPGYRTTEFWLTLGLAIVTLLVTAFRDAPGIGGKVAALVGTAITVSGYSVSRGLVKGASK